MRAFVALDLPEPLLAPLTRLQAGLGVGRPVPEENLHLTLAFLEDLPGPKLDDFAEALSEIALPPVPLTLAGLDLFPQALFTAADGEGLDRLHAKVQRAARETGLVLPRTRFRPHVTLARLPRDLAAPDRARLADTIKFNARFTAGPAPATSFTLYRSHLRPQGALHEPLASLPLTG